MIYLINRNINTFKALYIFIILLFLISTLKNGKISKKLNTDKISENCYSSPDNSGIRIIYKLKWKLINILKIYKIIKVE